MSKTWEVRETRVRDLLAKYNDILINWGIRTHGLYFPSQVKHILDGFDRETMPVCNHDGTVDISGASRAKIAKMIEVVEKSDIDKTVTQLMADTTKPKPSYYQIIQGGKQIGNNWAVSPTQADADAALTPGNYVINAMDVRGYITGTDIITVEGKADSNGQGNNNTDLLVELMKAIVTGMNNKQPQNDINSLNTYMMEQSKIQQVAAADMQKILFEKLLSGSNQESTDVKSRFEEMIAIMGLAKRLNPEGPDGWASVAMEMVSTLGESVPELMDALTDAIRQKKEVTAENRQLPPATDFEDLRPSDSVEEVKTQNGKKGEKIVKMP